MLLLTSLFVCHPPGNCGQSLCFCLFFIILGFRQTSKFLINILDKSLEIICKIPSLRNRDLSGFVTIRERIIQTLMWDKINFIVPAWTIFIQFHHQRINRSQLLSIILNIPCWGSQLYTQKPEVNRYRNTI